MTDADRKRLAVLRNIQNVFGYRLHESMAESRSVTTEVVWLADRKLVESYRDLDGELRFRITDAGRDQLDEWETSR